MSDSNMLSNIAWPKQSVLFRNGPQTQSSFIFFSQCTSHVFVIYHPLQLKKQALIFLQRKDACMSILYGVRGLESDQKWFV